ncbi:MAG: hypothetical protein IPH31_17645 [Lewinellaceae bacterium]|nr:hypothetical protein [Lewinellaceae bacterium]
MWDDAGSGGTYGDCNIWRMKCPEGYVALGDIVTSDDPANAGSVRCIKKTAVNALGATVALVSCCGLFKSRPKRIPRSKHFGPTRVRALIRMWLFG